MDQVEFDKLVSCLSKNKRKDFSEEVCLSLKHDEILLHYLGGGEGFELKNVINNIKDKIALQELKIQNHNIIGLEQLLKDLLSIKDDKIVQMEVINKYFGYFIFLMPDNLGNLIGIYKKITQNIEKDIMYQRDLLSLGHPNRDIYLFEKGKIIGNISDLGIL